MNNVFHLGNSRKIRTSSEIFSTVVIRDPPDRAALRYGRGTFIAKAPISMLDPFVLLRDQVRRLTPAFIIGSEKTPPCSLFGSRAAFGADQRASAFSSAAA